MRDNRVVTARSTLPHIWIPENRPTGYISSAWAVKKCWSAHSDLSEFLGVIESLNSLELHSFSLRKNQIDRALPENPENEEQQRVRGNGAVLRI